MNITGITVIIIRACAGSIVVGVRRCWKIMLTPISSGSTRTGSSRPGMVKSDSGAERSLIQSMNGAWRSSMELCSA